MRGLLLVVMVSACGSAQHGPTPPPRDRVAECRQTELVVSRLMGLPPELGPAEDERCLDQNLTRAQIACFLGADSVDDLSDCNPRKLTDRASQRDREASINVRAIYAGAKAYFKLHGRFPVGDTGVVPGPPLCQGGLPKPHLGAADDFVGPLWVALDFREERPYDFSYRYRSDGRSFTVTAQGDADCNGTLTSYRIGGRVVGGAFVLVAKQVDQPGQ